MVPADFALFFSVMAGVGATLFGLIFLVITIKPEVTHVKSVSVMHQVQVASSYGALLNPLIISLLALVPHATIGTITLCMSLVGLVSTVVMGASLFQDALSWARKLKSVLFVFSSLVIFSFEIDYGIRLVVTPGDLAALSSLTTLLVLIYLYGIARAWDLVGARQFQLHDLFLPLVPKSVGELLSDAPPAESTKDASTQRD